MTKTFTAAVLASMAADGTVRLDQPVAELLPLGTAVPGRGGRRITLLDLATQSSGLPRMPANFTPKNPANPYADYDGARLLAFLARYQLPRDVGAQYEYSALGLAWNRMARPAGYHAFIGFAPARHVGVVVLSSSASDVDDIALHLLDDAIPLAPPPNAAPPSAPSPTASAGSPATATARRGA